MLKNRTKASRWWGRGASGARTHCQRMCRPILARKENCLLVSVKLDHSHSFWPSHLNPEFHSAETHSYVHPKSQAGRAHSSSIRDSRYLETKQISICAPVGKQDHPGGPVVKNPPASAGDMRSIPGSGRPYMPRGNQALVLDSLCFSAGEAMRWEARTLTPQQPPLAATRESP